MFLSIKSNDKMILYAFEYSFWKSFCKLKWTMILQQALEKSKTTGFCVIFKVRSIWKFDADKRFKL